MLALDFTAAFTPKGLNDDASGFSTLKAIYGADNVQFRGLDPVAGLRSSDNLVWSADGFIDVQEDRSVSPFGTQEASVWKLDPDEQDQDSFTGQALVERWAQINRSAVPVDYGQSESDPTSVGEWESSGIIDVSEIFGEPVGRLFLSTVQAHSLADGNILGGNDWWRVARFC